MQVLKPLKTSEHYMTQKGINWLWCHNQPKYANKHVKSTSTGPFKSQRLLVFVAPGVHIINILCAHFFVWKFYQSQTLSREKLLKILSYEKRALKMLMKLTPGVNLISPTFHKAAFATVDLQCTFMYGVDCNL